VLLDLGCGTGEHARFFAERWERVFGVDASRAAVEEARRQAGGEGIRWIRGDLRFLPVSSAVASVAVCLGNTLVILQEDRFILDALKRVRASLKSGGLFLIQILNYHRLRSQNARHLPLNFREEVEPAMPQERRELVYLRFMDFDTPLHVSFHVVTLRRSLQGDHVQVIDSVRRRLRSLEYRELGRLLQEAGFQGVELYGSYAPSPFEPENSLDVLAVARRD
jgi:SAM-dependent methyltransferase